MQDSNFCQFLLLTQTACLKLIKWINRKGRTICKQQSLKTGFNPNCVHLYL